MPMVNSGGTGKDDDRQSTHIPTIGCNLSPFLLSSFWISGRSQPSISIFSNSHAARACRICRGRNEAGRKKIARRLERRPAILSGPENLYGVIERNRRASRQELETNSYLFTDGRKVKRKIRNLEQYRSGLGSHRYTPKNAKIDTFQQTHRADGFFKIIIWRELQ